MQIGFIGLGKLGMPCAEAVADKGYNVHGYDILPKQSTNSLSKTLKEILSLQPTHISAYALTFEKGTEFFSLKQLLTTQRFSTKLISSPK